MHDDKQVPPPGVDGGTFYGLAELDAKGRISLPDVARRDYGLAAGDRFVIIGQAEGLALITSSTLVEVVEAAGQLLADLERHEMTARSAETRRERSAAAGEQLVIRHSERRSRLP